MPNFKPGMPVAILNDKFQILDVDTVYSVNNGFVNLQRSLYVFLESGPARNPDVKFCIVEATDDEIELVKKWIYIRDFWQYKDMSYIQDSDIETLYGILKKIEHRMRK